MNINHQHSKKMKHLSASDIESKNSAIMERTDSNMDAVVKITSFLIAASIGKPRNCNVVSVISSALAESIEHIWLLEDVSQSMQNILCEIDSRFYWKQIKNLVSQLDEMDVLIDTEKAMRHIHEWHY